MQCLKPITIKNEKPINISIYGRTMQVPCGKCEACIDNKRKQWYYRLKQEERASCNAYFITLTYADDKLPRNSLGYPTFCVRDIQLFLKKLRKNFETYQSNLGWPKEVWLHARYFLIGEYGSKYGRPHYHALLFNVPYNLDLFRAVLKCWNKGRISVSPCNGARIGYCANYMYGKSDKVPEEYVDETNAIPLLCSRKPGIGANYLSAEIKRWHKAGNRSYVMDGDIKYPMPRFYKDKIWDNTWSKARLYKQNYARILEQKHEEYQKDIEYRKVHPDEPDCNLPSNQKKNVFIRQFRNRVKKHKNNNLFNHE